MAKNKYGSFELISSTRGINMFCGLEEDVSKLPKNVRTGSIALCVNTGVRYIFEKTTGKWYAQPLNSGSSQEIDFSTEGSSLVISY